MEDNKTKQTNKRYAPQLEESTKNQFGVALAVCLSLILTIAAIGAMAAYANWDTITRLLA